jgi:hypothetical protein
LSEQKKMQTRIQFYLAHSLYNDNHAGTAAAATMGKTVSNMADYKRDKKRSLIGGGSYKSRD